MMLRLAFLAALALTSAAMAAQTTNQPLMTWPDLISRPRPKPDATVSYGDAPTQKVDVWLPKGKGPFPTVLMVHGGCWQTSIADRTLMDWAADDLRRDGFAVWNIDYRGVDRPGGGYPGTFQDAAQAADLLRSDAARFHLDADHVVAVGHSAGGHLALWLAARHNLPKNSPLAGADPLKIAHVISLGGLPDLEATAASSDNGCGTDVVGQLVGPATAVHPDPYADTSVTRLLPLGVPQDLVDGREDRIIPYRLPVSYAAKARAAGDDVTLHTVPDTGHVELIAPGTAAWSKTKQLVERAFGR
jgi:acetyl esterase/lipase